MKHSSVKFYFFSIAVFCATITSFSLFAQSKPKHKKAILKNIHPITLGFQSGRELLFNSSPLIRSRQSKVHSGISSTLVLRKPLNAHFKIETGLTYSAIQGTGNYNFGYNVKKPGNFAVPLTGQYYFLPEKCRLHPFLGCGVQYNLSTGNNPISPFKTSDNTTSTSSYQSGTKYISILFTQGMTFEVNTKIEISESFHFLPSNTEKTIGIDLGFGYKFN